MVVVMKTTDFSFELPPSLIAQFPPEERGQSRLMVLDRKTGARSHRWVRDLPDILQPGSLLVFNDSRVRKARLLGTPVSGVSDTAEFLLLKRIDERTWQTMTRRARRRRLGSRYRFPGNRDAEIVGADREYRLLCFDQAIDDEWLDRYGHVPLPPYIKRGDTREDDERYQTVYARQVGSSAAPTAGLHFTRELLDVLKQRGIETAFVTLHVGLGTFLPVRAGRIEDHVMHEELFSIDEETALRIERAKAEGRRIIAVGTTVVRTLESAWQGGTNGRLLRGERATSIFIYPGYEFRVVDGVFTNFHTPESTLLMLVSAFAGREFVLDSYAEAIREGYCFFSYGDAMLIP
jgi:S-adenosylmethionine:tRNA ribosyltransferase-isomerase